MLHRNCAKIIWINYSDHQRKHQNNFGWYTPKEISPCFFATWMNVNVYSCRKEKIMLENERAHSAHPVTENYIILKRNCMQRLNIILSVILLQTRPKRHLFKSQRKDNMNGTPLKRWTWIMQTDSIIKAEIQISNFFNFSTAPDTNHKLIPPLELMYHCYFQWYI